MEKKKLISRELLIKFSSILFYLIPITLLTGPFLPDLFISIISIIFLTISFYERSYVYFKNNFFYIFLIFCFYLIIRSITSENILLSLESSLFYIRFGIFSLSIWFLIDRNKKLSKNFTIFLLLSFCIALFDGLYQYIFGENIFGYTVIGDLKSIRMTLLLSEESILGGYLARLFPLVLALLIHHFYSNKIIVFLIFILLIITDLVVFFSGERTAIALMFIFTMLILIMISRFRLSRVITFLISIMIIVFFTLNSPQLIERNINQTLTQMNIVPSQDNLSKDDEPNPNIRIFSTTHEYLYVSAYNMFKDNFFFGVGPKLFRQYCSNEDYAYYELENEKTLSCSTHPHNSYIQLMSETGVVGLSFILIFFGNVSFLLINHLYRKIRLKKLFLTDYQVLLLCSIFLSLFPLLPTQNIFNNWINIIYFLPIGFYLQSIMKNNT